MQRLVDFLVENTLPEIGRRLQQLDVDSLFQKPEWDAWGPAALAKVLVLYCVRQPQRGRKCLEALPSTHALYSRSDYARIKNRIVEMCEQERFLQVSECIEARWKAISV
ncbi:hypothetical protein [Pseudomarimonas arenosa]|uniref:Uncharacterized protein n=1 Tax=Pseudomarimonas arenosa TaxID=2774145 RepID=A0AAW3ZRY4_9GAMM|nr:hypothetical protein [Pseudomarimonas arenosa]MBD8528290.1 hypothetical protein [Pseudomarimonas arenosa]